MFEKLYYIYKNICNTRKDFVRENMIKDYSQYINEIEECKNKLSEGMTSKCKKLIDECYSVGAEKRIAELELYDRKTLLFNKKKLCL